jgi:broad specificity phosphatase PhoE
MAGSKFDLSLLPSIDPVGVKPQPLWDSVTKKGESQADLEARADRVWALILAQPATEIAVVVHGGFCFSELMQHPGVVWTDGWAPFTNIQNCSVVSTELSVDAAGWCKEGGASPIALRLLSNSNDRLRRADSAQPSPGTCGTQRPVKSSL